MRVVCSLFTCSGRLVVEEFNGQPAGRLLSNANIQEDPRTTGHGDHWLEQFMRV